MYFLVPVWADLIRVLAHASAWEHMPVLGNPYDSMYFKNVFGSKMYFLVPVWADLIRVLAHACAWENRT